MMSESISWSSSLGFHSGLQCYGVCAAVDFEAIYLGDIRALGNGRGVLGVNLEEDVREGGPEEGTVDGAVSGEARCVDVLAAGAEDLDCVAAGAVGFAGREDGLLATRDE